MGEKEVSMVLLKAEYIKSGARLFVSVEDLDEFLYELEGEFKAKGLLYESDLLARLSRALLKSAMGCGL